MNDNLKEFEEVDCTKINVSAEEESLYTQEVDTADIIGIQDTLSIYLKEITRYPLLTKEEEFNLAKEFKETGSIEAKNKLINHNLRLVVNVAKHFKCRDVALIDLIAEGNLGLIKGIEKYEPDMGFRLSTYCIYWIKQACGRYIQNNSALIRVPVHLGEKLFRYRKYMDKYKEENDSIPTNSEVKKALKIDDNTLMFLQFADRPIVSLDTPIGEEEDSVLSDFVSDGSFEVEDEVMLGCLRRSLEEAMSVCKPREKEVLLYRFGFYDGKSYTLEEVGQIFGVTRERIRQIESKALKKLRHPSRKILLKDYTKEG